MSRSYKKGYTSWHHTSEDKWARTTYNRCRRSKDNRILRDCKIFYKDCNISSEDSSKPPSDLFCKERVDYSVSFSDKWCWPSDGGSYYRENLNTVRQDINEELANLDTAWNEYCNYREAKNVSKYSHSWKLSYEIPIGFELKLDSSSVYKKGMQLPLDSNDYCYKLEASPWNENTLHLNKYVRQPITKKVEKNLNHSPRKRIDIPTNAINISIWKKDKWKYRQAHGDWGLMSFLFYRNLIPTTFNSREEMTSWIIKHSEEIANKWFRIKNRK